MVGGLSKGLGLGLMGAKRLIKDQRILGGENLEVRIRG